MVAWSNGRNMRLVAMMNGQMHQCVKQRLSGQATAEFHTLCGLKVPHDAVQRGEIAVTCPDCARAAGDVPV